jgi:hypothetical protein
MHELLQQTTQRVSGRLLREVLLLASESVTPEA